MPRPTRTFGPLHFEDLEPHRFEDLVRALLYDFRPWLKLEGTGRGGGDDGFDVRAWEAPPATTDTQENDEDNGDEAVDFLAGARLWLIQCKRERTIGPAKLKAYLDSISKDQRAELSALLFVASCDFTKKARDLFRVWCVEAGIGEYHLWGKTELEDALLQPKNDGLLFAFFGISVVIRRRSIKTELRARLATKRKIAKVVGQIGRDTYKVCLFRDPTDDRYPNVPKGVELTPEPGKFGYCWFVRTIVQVRHDGILVSFRDRMAYLSDDGARWDSIKIPDRAVPDSYENPWEHDDDAAREARRAYAADKFWSELPDANRANMKSFGFISYDDILAIDEAGDENVTIPVIFVAFDVNNNGPFAWGFGGVEVGEKWIENGLETRIDFFPKEFPDDTPSPPVQMIDD